MATGLSLPVSVNDLGRAVISSGTDQLTKLLLIALQPCSSANPFQQLGLTERVIFSVNSPNIRAQLNREVSNIFATFQRDGRARLRNVSFEKDSTTQELKMFITWQDLETTRDRDLVLVLNENGNVRPRVAESLR